MNPHFGLLLSRAYDGSLAPEHLADLRKSGLTDETIAANLIRSVPPAMIRHLLGFDVPAIRSALLFPFRSPQGGFADHPRVKIFPPLLVSVVRGSAWPDFGGANPYRHPPIWPRWTCRLVHRWPPDALLPDSLTL